MKKRIEDINFDNIDISDYQEEIDNLNRQFDKLMKNKRIQRALKKYEQEKRVSELFNKKWKKKKNRKKIEEFLQNL